MNDFTKAELEYIYRKFTLTNGNEFEWALDAKLSAMIENYCEHNNKEELHNDR